MSLDKVGPSHAKWLKVATCPHLNENIDPLLTNRVTGIKTARLTQGSLSILKTNHIVWIRTNLESGRD